MSDQCKHCENRGKYLTDCNSADIPCSIPESWYVEQLKKERDVWKEKGQVAEKIQHAEKKILIKEIEENERLRSYILQILNNRWDAWTVHDKCVEALRGDKC